MAILDVCYGGDEHGKMVRGHIGDVAGWKWES